MLDEMPKKPATHKKQPKPRARQPKPASSEQPQGIKLVSSWGLVSKSWQLVVQHPFSLLWLVLIPSVLSAVGGQLVPSVQPEAGATFGQQWANTMNMYANHDDALLISALAGLWILLVFPATVVMGTRIARGASDDPAKFLSESRHYFWRLYGLNILVGIIVVLGLIAFIVPGLIFLRRYLLSQYYLVSQDLSIREAMRTSAAETKPVSGYVWGTLGVLIFFSFASSLAFDAPWIGPLLGPLVALIYYFGVPLRQREIAGK